MRRPAVSTCALAVLLSATGCAATPAAEAPTPAPTVGAAIDRLHDQIEGVARAHQAADARLAGALDAVRAMDALVDGLRSAPQVDDAKDRWPAVDGAVSSVEVGTLREPFLAVAHRIDTARGTLRRVRDELPEGWERRYLDAEDEVLTALRTYAEAADRLAQTLQRSWPVYEELHERAADFVERRWFYRTSQEAADAFELEVQSLLDELTAARAAIAAARSEREEAAEAVNAATEAAARVWTDRPAPSSPA